MGATLRGRSFSDFMQGGTMITVQAFAIALSAVFLLLVGSVVCVTVRARRAPERWHGIPGQYRFR